MKCNLSEDVVGEGCLKGIVKHACRGMRCAYRSFFGLIVCGFLMSAERRQSLSPRQK